MPVISLDDSCCPKKKNNPYLFCSTLLCGLVKGKEMDRARRVEISVVLVMFGQEFSFSENSQN